MPDGGGRKPERRHDRERRQVPVVLDPQPVLDRRRDRGFTRAVNLI
jgi:hypothetical protein